MKRKKHDGVDGSFAKLGRNRDLDRNKVAMLRFEFRLTLKIAPIWLGCRICGHLIATLKLKLELGSSVQSQ